MTSSFTGGINAPFNVLLQRGLNLLDVTDPVAARQNIGAVGGADLKTLTFGGGLTSGTYNTTSTTTIAVDSDASGAAGKVVKTDANGDLTTTQQLNFGSTGSYIQRVTGTNGAMTIRNTGTGTLQLNSAGTMQLVSAGSGSITTTNGLTVSLANDPYAGHTALSVNTTGANTGSLGLAVTGGATIDTLSLSGALSGTSAAFSGAVSGTTGTFTGAISGTTGTFSDAFSGTSGTFSGAISGTTGTFSGAVSGTNATFTSLKTTAQPSFCLVTSADKSAASAQLISQTPSADILRAVPGFSYSTPVRGVTQQGSLAQVIFPTAGRYFMTVSGKVEGNGKLGLYDGIGSGAQSTTSIVLVNNPSGVTPFTSSIIIDIVAGDTFSLLVTNTVGSSAFTLYAGATWTGYMIG